MITSMITGAVEGIERCSRTRIGGQGASHVQANFTLALTSAWAEGGVTGGCRPGGCAFEGRSQFLRSQPGPGRANMACQGRVPPVKPYSHVRDPAGNAGTAIYPRTRSLL